MASASSAGDMRLLKKIRQEGANDTYILYLLIVRQVYDEWVVGLELCSML